AAACKVQAHSRPLRRQPRGNAPGGRCLRHRTGNRPVRQRHKGGTYLLYEQTRSCKGDKGQPFRHHMIKVLSGKIEELDMKETLRYLGYAGVKSADGIEGVMEECRGMILPVLAPKAVYEEFPLIHGEENRLD